MNIKIKIRILYNIIFKTKTRIEHAKKLFQIYGQNVTVLQVAIKSGFPTLYIFQKDLNSLPVFPQRNIEKVIFYTKSIDNAKHYTIIKLIIEIFNYYISKNKRSYL